MSPVHLLLASTLKVSLILLLALAATTLLRRRSAAVRHWILTAAILCAAITPVLEAVVPAWDLRAQPSSGRIELADTLPARISGGVEQKQTDAASRLNVIGLIAPVWIAGAGISVFVLLVGLARLSWLASRARPLMRGTWNEIAEEISRKYGLQRSVLLLQAEHPTLLVTWGLVQPKVMLPAEALDWTEDRVRIVLSHELAHVRRQDWLVQMTAELLRAAFWFDPLVWIACRRLRQESEQACDDAVLNLGVEGSEYATHLLDLARAFRRHRRTWLPPAPAPAIARSSSLERRVRAMLNARLNRTPITRTACVAIVIGVLSITVPIAGFGAGAQAGSATFAGALLDTFKRVVPDVQIVLTNVKTMAKQEGRSDANGRFRFTNLPPGDYELEAQMPAFAIARHRVSLRAGQNVQRDITLQLGSVQETITVSGNGPPRAPRTSSRERPADQPDADPCSQTQIGGCVNPPRKLADTRPHYPEHLYAAKVEGTVMLEGRIGVDGFVNGLRIVTSPDPDLAAAAVDAVRQWEFTPTRLDGVPVEVIIKVTVNFKIQL